MGIETLLGVGGALLSAKSSRDQTKAANEQNALQAAMQKRRDNIVFGEDDKGGLMAQFQALMNQPQSDAMNTIGRTAENYAMNYGGADSEALRSGAYGLMDRILAPQAQAAQGSAAQANPGPHVNPYGQEVMWNKGETFSAPDAMQAAQIGPTSKVQAPQGLMANLMNASTMGAAQVNAPSQNAMDLRGSYDSFINGQAGNNPWLTGAIGKGINQSTAAFQDMQDDATRNLMQTVLPSIRSNAILAGGLGGSRQGIAEGMALSTLAREGQRAASRFGQNNTDAAVSAQAGAYNTDRDRALQATQGLGAQQYGVAQQNAALQQQADAANMGAQNQASMANQGAQNAAAQTNYSGLLQAAMANAGADNQAASQNAGLQQQANQVNYGGQLQTNQQNAANLQQANLANQNAGNAASQFNAQQNQAAGVANSGLVAQNNQFNAGLQQQMGLANMGNQQQTGLANMQSRLSTNGLNSANTQAGMAGLTGLLDTAYNRAANQDNWNVNRAGQVSGIMQPYLSGVPSNAQPYFSNTGGSALGGAVMGMQLGNMLRGSFGGMPATGGIGSGIQSMFPNGY